VCQALVAAGHHVVALVRNPGKPEAAELRGLGVELLLGDTKCASLSRAALCFAVVCARPVRADAATVCSDLTRQDTPQMEKVGTCDWVVWLSVNWVRCIAHPPRSSAVAFVSFFVVFPGRFLGGAAHQKERSPGAQCFMILENCFMCRLPSFHAPMQKLEATSSAPNTKGFIFSGGVAGSLVVASQGSCPIIQKIALHCITLYCTALH
jgi:hypothetical protein